MMSKLFKYCGPVINSDSEFARYILDPIALQVIIDGNQDGTSKVRTNYATYFYLSILGPYLFKCCLF